MEKNIASHDLSDMLMNKGIYELSLKFTKPKFSHAKRIVEKLFRAFELALRFVKKTARSVQRSISSKPYASFDTTAAAFYSISMVSAVISFFWFMLLVSL